MSEEKQKPPVFKPTERTVAEFVAQRVGRVIVHIGALAIPVDVYQPGHNVRVVVVELE